MKLILIWGFWIFGPSSVIALGVVWISSESCASTLPSHVGKAWHMMAYIALVVGLGIAPQVKGVSRWMQRRLVYGLRGLRATSATWDEVYGPEIKSLIERTIRRFSVTMGGMSCLMFFYLILLTLFPNRCIVLEERIVVVLLSLSSAGVLVHGYWITSSKLKKVVEGAKMFREVAMASALKRNPSRVGKGSREERSE